MPRYKVVEHSPRFLPVVLEWQLLAGRFEYALRDLIDNEIDVSAIDARFCSRPRTRAKARERHARSAHRR